MSLRRIYTGQKYPHIYTLSIITCKNQSMKVHDALYIPIYEYDYKVVTRCDIILQEDYIIDGLRDLNMRIQGSQNFPTSGVANAKWRAGISTHVSRNSNHKHALKIVP